MKYLYHTLFFTLFISCNSTNQKSIPLVQENNSNWIYLDNINEISGDTTKMAICISENKLPFSPPNKDSIGRLAIKIQIKGNDTNIAFMTNYGQIFNTKLRVKFDKNEPIDFTGYYPTDGSVDYFYMYSPEEFYSYLIKSKTIIIEALFYQEGRNSGVFKVDNFKWRANTSNNLRLQ